MHTTHTLVTNHPLGSLNALLMVFDDCADRVEVEVNKSQVELPEAVSEEGRSSGVITFKDDLGLTDFIDDFSENYDVLAEGLEWIKIFDQDRPVVYAKFVSRKLIPVKLDLDSSSIPEDRVLERFMQLVSRIHTGNEKYKATIVPYGTICGWQHEDTKYNLSHEHLEIEKETSTEFIPYEMVRGYELREEKNSIKLQYSIGEKLVMFLYTLLLMKEFSMPTDKIYFADRSQVSGFIEFLDYFIATYHNRSLEDAPLLSNLQRTEP